MLLLLLPALLAAECPPLAEPSNGILVDSVWIPGAKAIRCNYGFVPLGTGVATCEEDVWSESVMMLWHSLLEVMRKVATLTEQSC